MTAQLIVYYNTKCPVCDAGITQQRSKLRALAKAHVVEWRDINLEPNALFRFGANIEAVRKRLHAVDAQGQLLVGIDVAIAVWRLTPGQAWLATLFDLPVMHGIAALAYNGFAAMLYRWNRGKKHW